MTWWLQGKNISLQRVWWNVEVNVKEEEDEELFQNQTNDDVLFPNILLTFYNHSSGNR